jgi:hypothetical protein
MKQALTIIILLINLSLSYSQIDNSGGLIFQFTGCDSLELGKETIYVQCKSKSSKKIYCDTLNHLVLSKRKSLVLPEGEYNLTVYGSLYKTIKIIDVEILKEKITLLELQLSLRENKNFNKIRIKYSRPKREECGL